MTTSRPHRISTITVDAIDHVDFDRDCLRLPDSKTGAKIVYLNAPARSFRSYHAWKITRE